MSSEASRSSLSYASSRFTYCNLRAVFFYGHGEQIGSSLWNQIRYWGMYQIWRGAAELGHMIPYRFPYFGQLLDLLSSKPGLLPSSEAHWCLWQLRQVGSARCGATCLTQASSILSLVHTDLGPDLSLASLANCGASCMKM